MVEVAGELSVTFSVRSLLDLQRLLDICRHFDIKPIFMKQEKVRSVKLTKGGKHVSKEEMQEKIIQLLKTTFKHKGFDIDEAAALVEKKLDRRKTTVQKAVALAVEKGVLQRKGGTHAFTEFIQQRIATKLQEQARDVLPPIASTPGGQMS